MGMNVSEPAAASADFHPHIQNSVKHSRASQQSPKDPIQHTNTCPAALDPEGSFSRSQNLFPVKVSVTFLVSSDGDSL